MPEEKEKQEEQNELQTDFESQEEPSKKEGQNLIWIILTLVAVIVIWIISYFVYR